MAKYNIINQNNLKLKSFPKISAREYNLKVRISARNNAIHELPDYFERLSSLEYLNLSGNRFEDFPIILSDLMKIEEIYFDQNSIWEIDAIGDMTSLRIVSFSDNLIEKIPDEIVNLQNLKIFNLSNNKLKMFPNKLCYLRNLKKLNLSNNDIYNLPTEIKLLKSLTHLYLRNTKLDRLPKEIIELKNLKELHLEDNNFKLPKNYDPRKPKNIIDFIIKQQKFAELKTTKAFVFKNISKKVISDKYNSIFEDFTANKGIDIVYIEKLKDITKDATVVFFIICFDIHKEPQLIYDLISKCKKLDINYYILMEEDIIGGRVFLNLAKGEQIDTQHLDLKKQFNINFYEEYEELTNFVFNAVNQRAPSIKLKNIQLENIGHFTKLDIPISENICCLVGENGTGKSTVLKAIALAAIGYDFEGVDMREIYNLLKIENLNNDNIRQYSNGHIKLDYTIDGDLFSNEINIVNNQETGVISINKNGAFEISTTGYNLKSLLLGFPQIRGGVVKDNISRPKKLNQPHFHDLIPLINGSDDNRLNSFGNWIEQLYIEAIKKEYEIDNEKNARKEWVIIEKAFEVISSFSDHEISFNTVEVGKPNEVWVNTVGAPNGIPLNLVSQGLKVIMGWLGYFIQRLIESYPVQTPDQVLKSHAILIIDEIDSYLHPKWQAKILNILRQIFPNTQFIISTHSPIAVSSCNEGEVVVLNISNNEIASSTLYNTKGWLVENILLDIMGIDSTRDSEVTKKINEIETLFLKKYNDKLSSVEKNKLDGLIKSIDNLPAGDPVLTLLNLRALGGSLTKNKNNA